MHNKLNDVPERFISYISSICDDFGLNRFVAQLYGVLYLSNKPMSLDDLSERLMASKGNVSINIRELEKWGAVKKIWIKGSRKDYYEAELDIKKILSNKLKSSVQKRLSGVSDLMDELKEIIKSQPANLTAEEKEVLKVYQDRLAKIEEMKKLATMALSFADKFL